MSVNPWSVDSLEAFSYLCCPECVFRSKKSEVFETHAVQNHPQSFAFFGHSNIKEDDYPSVKSEPNEEHFYEGDPINPDDLDVKLEVPPPSSDNVIKEDPSSEDKLWSCDQCEFQTHSKGGLTSHQAIHAEELNCSQCSFTCRSRSTMKYHQKTTHDPNYIPEVENVPCNLCSKKFKTQRRLQSHIEHDHEGKGWTCLFCDQEFKIRSELTSHYSSEHPNGGNCQQCSKHFTKPGLYKTHLMAVHWQTMKGWCEICKRSYKDIANHNRDFHSNSEGHFACDKCSYSTTYERNLRIHIKKIHERLPFLDDIRTEKKDMVKCPECGDIIKDWRYSQHYQYYHKSLPPGLPEESTFVCDICSAVLISKQGFDEHKKSHLKVKKQDPVPKGPKMREFICAKCGIKCSTKHRYINHFKDKHSSYPPELEPEDRVCCEQCGKSILSSSLPGHMRNMHKKTQEELEEHRKQVKLKYGDKYRNKRHTCQECGKSFKTYGSCDDHFKKVHEKITPFQCSECSMKFATRARLQNHIRVKHTRVKCDTCQIVLYNSDNLKVHNFKEHGIIPEGGRKCDHCDSIFMTEGNLKKHLISKHSD